MGTAAWVAVVVVVALVVVFGIVMIRSKNHFAIQRNVVEESWRQVDVELQRRHDLIGILVEVVKAAARFEQQTLAQVIQARAQAMAAHGGGPVAQIQAERNLNSAMARFFAITERYPELRASRDFQYLEQQMVAGEDRIARGRQVYNDHVRVYNTRFDTFPSSMFAGGHRRAQYFEVDDPNVRAAPSLRDAFEGLGGPQLPPAQQATQRLSPQHPPAQPTRPWNQR